MSVYLDASVLVALLIEDVHTERAEAWLTGRRGVRMSRWTAAEASSALALNRRTGRLDEQELAQAEARLDARLATSHLLVASFEDDFTHARRLIRADPNLRAPDALHLAIAQRLDMTLMTFDRRLAEAAVRAGVEMAEV